MVVSWADCQSDAIKQVLNFPPDTNLSFKSHDASIAQRTALDEARKEKAASGPGYPRRRETLSEDASPDDIKG